MMKRPAAVLALMASSAAWALSFERVPVPADVTERFVACPMDDKPVKGTLLGRDWQWRTADEIRFDSVDWPKDVGAGLEALSLDKDIYATVIDIRQVAKGKHAFLYLSNGTYDKQVQPWSSSKFLAAASALTAMRAAGISADSTVGGVRFGDFVSSSMHGFPAGAAVGQSNEIGTWLQNVAGRKRSNELVQKWLKRPRESFAGGYGKLLDGDFTTFKDKATGKTARVYAGDEGKGPTQLSTLTLAEALRRLATQGDAGNPTAWPGLTESDVGVVLYGSQSELGGMLVGIDGYVRQALGGKVRLDAATGGRWRVFGKMGAALLNVGNEQIVNAYVCLPKVDGGRAFILSVHAFGTVGRDGDKRLQSAVDAVVRAVVPKYFE
jgi:hypothetical protein